MAQPSKPLKPPGDEWGSSARVGYEDRGAFHAKRVDAPARKGSGFLRVLGSLLVVAGLAWITYIYTAPNSIHSIIRPDLQLRPIVVLGAGLLMLLLEKLLK